ncbi:MAG: NfeD family protein [Lachnospiraceae bacterium]|nr:NfeD family protein [Lachnospiraceae bacterium]
MNEIFSNLSGAGNQSGIWLVVLIAMLIVEASTVSLTSLWFAAGALAALIAALLGAPFWLQVVLFLVAALALLLLIRPISVRYFGKMGIRTNVESLIGKDAVVTEDIDNVAGKGEATVDGVVWTARMKEKEGKCSKGSICNIDSIEGVKLILKEKEGV